MESGSVLERNPDEDQIFCDIALVSMQVRSMLSMPPRLDWLSSLQPQRQRSSGDMHRAVQRTTGERSEAVSMRRRSEDVPHDQSVSARSSKRRCHS